jgi:ferritin-like metal-binding protein YciE
MFGKMKLDNLRKLYLQQLCDLYDAEYQILDALPAMEEAATTPELKTAFRQHLEKTEGHVRKLEQIFADLGEEPRREKCKGMKGLLAEGDDFVKAQGDPSTKDAALIAAAQRVEHYEIAGYGTARAYAWTLGHGSEAQWLQQVLDEEGEADKKLTSIAERTINVEAARA